MMKTSSETETAYLLLIGQLPVGVDTNHAL